MSDPKWGEDGVAYFDDTPNTAGSTPDIKAKLLDNLEKWRSKLLDLGRRNPLINCSFNQSRGLLELVFPGSDLMWRMLVTDAFVGANSVRLPWRRDLIPAPGVMESTSNAHKIVDDGPKDWNPPLADCRKSRLLTERDILTELGDKALDRRLRTFDGHAHLSLSEQGVHCLFVAFGFLTWFESADSEEALHSPLILIPVTLSRSSADAPWEISKAEDDIVDNLCLRQRLKQDFGLELPPLPDIGDLEEEGARLGYISAMKKAISDNPRWAIEDRCALGRFAFPKIAMWQDLGQHATGVLSHALCRSIGGDQTISPQRAFGSAEKLPVAAQLDDELGPGEVKAILDCDSSQLEAIVAARRGVSFVLDGPPGTGKSQTIANIIADALAEGRKVLFVSEKVSALEVVKRRLDDCGLGDFCLECHSSKANRKVVLDELKWCLSLPSEVYDDTTPTLHDAKQKRTSLNEYVRSIHRRREPLGLSPFELYGQVARLNRLGLSTKSRGVLPDIKGVDRVTFDGWRHLLDRTKEVSSVIREYKTHPWRGCQLTARTLSLSDDMQNHLEVLSRSFNSIASSFHFLVAEGLVEHQQTPGTLAGTLHLLKDALTAPNIPSHWFNSPEEIATTILRRCECESAIEEKRGELLTYIDDVEIRFPDAAVTDIVLDTALGWGSRLRNSLPEDVHRRHGFMVTQTDHLQSLTDQCDALNTSISTLIGHLSIPIEPEIPASTVPKLVSFALTIADGVPLRKEWLKAECRAGLRDACAASLSRLMDASVAALKVAGSIAPDRLGEMNQAFENSTLASAWAAIRPIVPNGQPDELTSLLKATHESLESLKRAEQSLRMLLENLNIIGEADVHQRPGRIHLTFSAASAACRARTHWDGVTVCHGAWANSHLRSQVSRACESVIGDLTEAAELRDQLAGLLSHRAFRPESATLAERSFAFCSFFQRLFGDFGSFRAEVADLFKGELPDTRTFMAELGRLRIYHRLKVESSQVAESVSTLLPSGHQNDDPAAWTGLRTAIVAFERLATELPEFVAHLPQRSITIDRAMHNRALTNLAEHLEIFQKSIAGSLLKEWFDERLRLCDLIERLTEIEQSTLICQSAWRIAGPFYSCRPATLDALLGDIGHVHEFATKQQEVMTTFNMFAELMPHRSAPMDSSSWHRILKGLDAAELCSKTPFTERQYDTHCVDGGIDSDALRSAAGLTEASHIQFVEALNAVETSIILSPPGKPDVDAMRRSVADIRRYADDALRSLSTCRRGLQEVAGIIRQGSNADCQQVLDDQLAVQTLRILLNRRVELDAFLIRRDVAIPATRDGGRLEALWLMERTQSDSLSNLVASVASLSETRRRVASTVDDVRQACGGDFPVSWSFLKTVFDLRSKTGFGTPVIDTPVHELAELLQRLSGEMGTLDEWLKFSRWRRDMKNGGFEAIVDELLAGRYEPEEATDIVLARFYRQLFDSIAAQDPILDEFDLQGHEQLREKFRQLDEWEIKAASVRIRQFQLGREDRPRAGWAAPATSEVGILQREIQKKRRLLPLRKLFAEIPGVLQRLKPCIMMSPLSVSTFLQSDELRFDLVIFDEASQVWPWDAIGAIYRGSQLIVAGDEKQLPPTNFFNRVDIEAGEDEDDDLSDFESILSLCNSIGMPGKRLRWHYRSRREPLIAFSNHHFYEGDLVTFPSIRDATGDAVRLEFVPDGRWIDKRNLGEAERVAELVISHHRSRPETSLGVIAFNASQQQAIEDAIYDRRRRNPEVDALFDVGLSEPLFIKNLENVQGDERDVIILSMAYGYNDAGKFLKNFGPLTKAGGERRLNVAVTRARDEIIFVASVRASDMDLSGSKSDGSHLLKKYLEYAERGVEALARTVDSQSGDAESPFESEVAAALERHGLNPVSQVGCGGFRIDLALKHPQRPGEFCLGIECDGATYHSSKTARDRDRIRQNVLEDLGWRIVRVWSTDWVKNPDRQIERILAEFELAVSSNQGLASVLGPTDETAIADGLKPRLIEQEATVGRTFSNIDDVPDGPIRASASVVVIRAGAVDMDDLIKLVARELGFARTGRKIRERVESIINEELRTGKLRRIGERIGPHFAGNTPD